MIFCSFWPDFSRSKKTILSPAHPGDAAVGGVFDTVVGRVDADQLVTVGYQLGHSYLSMGSPQYCLRRQVLHLKPAQTLSN